MVSRLCVGLAALVVSGVAAVPAAPVEVVGPSTQASRAVLPFDFNGDGFAELAIGAPREKLGSQRAGEVHVLKGSPAGPTARGDQVWSQRTRGVPGIAERRDRFGAALDSADFNGDGFADLAIGVPGESMGAADRTGALEVLYGSPGGLRARGSQLWFEGSPGVPGDPGVLNQFGTALGAGDFDGDGFADLAIGAPLDRSGAGQVIVLRGSSVGLGTAGAQSIVHPAVASAPEHPMGEAWFGSGLAVGDFNADGRADLAASAPHAPGGGAVDVVLGGPVGLGPSRTTLTGDALGVTGTCPPGTTPYGCERFMKILTAGDLNADGADDLVVESHQGAGGADMGASMGGTVAVLYSLGGTFDPAAAQVWRLDPTVPGGPDLPGQSGWFDWFGRSLAVGDLTGDGVDDLAVGAFPKGAAGWVYVLPGSSAGVTGNALLLTETAVGARGAGFAGSLAAARLGGGAQDWLIIGDSAAHVGRATDAGRVTTVLWAPGGTTISVMRDWSQSTRGVRGSSESGDQFGTVDRGVYPW